MRCLLLVVVVLFPLSVSPAQDDEPPLFIRGDCDADGEIGEWITEAVFLLRHLFLALQPVPCQDACDANDSGTLDLSDAIYSLNFGFLGGPRPPAPYPSCGVDPRALGEESDALDCERSPAVCQPRMICPEEAPDGFVEQPFQRGDINGQGSIDLTSSISLLNYLFTEGPEPPCLDAADVNDDGCLTMTDVLELPPFCSMWLGFSFCPELGPCEDDPTPDFLGCRVSVCE